MAAVTIQCPKCKNNFCVPPHMIGRPVKCPGCEWAFRAGDEQAPAAPKPQETPVAAAPAKVVPAVVVAPVAASPKGSKPDLELPAVRAVGQDSPSVPAKVNEVHPAPVASKPREVGRGDPAPASVGISTVAANSHPVAALTTGDAVRLQAPRRRSKSRGYLTLSLGVLLLVAVALAAGFGIGRRHGDPNSNQSDNKLTTSQSANYAKALKAADPGERAAAAEGLAELTHDVTATVPELTDALLGDNSPTVRAAAARALGALGPWAKAAIPTLTHASLNDPNEKVRDAAGVALERVGRPTGGDVPALIASLKSPNKGLRAAAAQLLGTLGNEHYVEARAAIEPLRKLLENKREPEGGVRLYAALALWNIDQHPQAIPGDPCRARRPGCRPP